MVGFGQYWSLYSTADNVEMISQYLSFLPLIFFLLRLFPHHLKNHNSSKRWIAKLSCSSTFGYLKQRGQWHMKLARRQHETSVSISVSSQSPGKHRRKSKCAKPFTIWGRNWSVKAIWIRNYVSAPTSRQRAIIFLLKAKWK